MASCLPCVPHTSGELELALQHAALPAIASPWVLVLEMVWGYIQHSFPHTRCLDLANLSVSAHGIGKCRECPCSSRFQTEWVYGGHSKESSAVIPLGLLLGSERALFPPCKAAELSGCSVRPEALLPGGKRGAEAGGMTTASVLAGPAGWAVLALVPWSLKLSSTSNEAELQVCVICWEFSWMTAQQMHWVLGEEQPPVKQPCIVASQVETRTAGVLSGKCF